MHVERLALVNLRCFERVSIEPHPGLNVLLGENGSGKTSVLEALYLLSYGRSFRAGGSGAVVQRGAEAATIHAVVRDGNGTHRLGLTRGQRDWVARVDGQPVGTLGALVRLCPAVCVEPGSQLLVVGPAEHRRRFMDWGVFHVEQQFLEAWQHYRRALQQRNALLRTMVAGRQAEIWEQRMAEAAERIDGLRQAYLTRWFACLKQQLAQWLPELGEPRWHYHRGWSATEPLDRVLATTRERDQVIGHTRAGAHRADWTLAFAEAPERHQLSRGQTKLLAIACVLAQFEIFRAGHGEAPILLMDDLASELDQSHTNRALRYVRSLDAQVWITGTQLPADISSMQVFHVEHGQILPSRSSA